MNPQNVTSPMIQLFLLLLTLTSQSLTQAVSSTPEPDKDPFVGTWKANAEKSHPKLDKIEASYVRTISRDGEEVVFSSRIKKPRSEGFSENHYKIRCDGQPHRVLCGEVPCTSSCSYVAANRVEGDTTSPDGKTSHWMREISTDNQEMTVFGFKDKARTKIGTIRVYDRVK